MAQFSLKTEQQLIATVLDGPPMLRLYTLGELTEGMISYPPLAEVLQYVKSTLTETATTTIATTADLIPTSAIIAQAPALSQEARNIFLGSVQPLTQKRQVLGALKNARALRKRRSYTEHWKNAGIEMQKAKPDLEMVAEQTSGMLQALQAGGSQQPIVLNKAERVKTFFDTLFNTHKVYTTGLSTFDERGKIAKPDVLVIAAPPSNGRAC